MPERHLFYSPLAKRDLDETYDYISRQNFATRPQRLR